MNHARLLRLTLAAWLVAATLAGTAVAGPLDDADSAYGRGDYATALRLWQPLADQGDAKAQFHLGVMYEIGVGVPQDAAAAVKWFRKAADQGEAMAQLNLGFMYFRGQGVPQDYAASAKWYRKAADQGDAMAQFHLGFMYFGGQGVPQDYVQAHKWFNLAASRFKASEGEFRDKVVRGRDLVATKMTPAQIAEAQKLARDWKPKSEGRK